MQRYNSLEMGNSMNAAKLLLTRRATDQTADIKAYRSEEECKTTAEEKLLTQGFVISRKFVSKKPYIYIDHVHKKWAVAGDGEAEPKIYAFSDVLGCNIWENSAKNCNALRVNIIVNDAENPLICVNLISFPAAKDSFVYKNEIACAQNIMSTFIYMKSQPGAAPAGSIENIPEAIRQLAGLEHEGILTEKEFEQKKTELLSRM